MTKKSIDERLWLRFLRLQHRVERLVHNAIRDYADGLRRRLLRQVKFLDYNPNEEADILWSLIEPQLIYAAEQISELVDFTPDWSIYDAKVSARLRRQKRRIKWVTDYTWERLKKKLDEALEAGGSVSDMVKAIEEVVGELEFWRGERIARTEASAAVNGAFHEAAVAAGIEKKMWLTALDERTRLTHAQAHGQIVGINEPFIVGGYLMQFPADPSVNAPEEVINCRCTMIVVLD